jgi:hypothetical protein
MNCSCIAYAVGSLFPAAAASRRITRAPPDRRLPLLVRHRRRAAFRRQRDRGGGGFVQRLLQRYGPGARERSAPRRAPSPRRSRSGRAPAPIDGIIAQVGPHARRIAETVQGYLPAIGAPPTRSPEWFDGRRHAAPLRYLGARLAAEPRAPRLARRVIPGATRACPLSSRQRRAPEAYRTAVEHAVPFEKVQTTPPRRTAAGAPRRDHLLRDTDGTPAGPLIGAGVEPRHGRVVALRSRRTAGRSSAVAWSQSTSSPPSKRWRRALHAPSVTVRSGAQRVSPAARAPRPSPTRCGMSEPSSAPAPLEVATQRAAFAQHATSHPVREREHAAR